MKVVLGVRHVEVAFPGGRETHPATPPTGCDRSVMEAPPEERDGIS